MSISKMDWSRRNPNGAVTHPNNQQYLPQSTSSTVQTMQSHKALVPPNSYSTAQTFSTNSASHNLILKSLLGAKSIDEIANIQLSALSKAAPQQPLQISSGQYNSSFSSQQKTTTATNQQSSCNVQNPVVANYQMQIYPSSVLQNFQQAQLGQQLQQMPIVQQQTQPLHILQQVQALPIIQQQTQPMQQARPMPIAQQQTQPMPIVQQQMQQPQSMCIVQQQQSMPSVQQQAQPVQCYGVIRYNTREVQQAPQTTQSGGYSHNNAYKEMLKTYGGQRYSKNVQTSYQSMPQTNDKLIYSSPNGNAVQYVATYKAGNDINVPVSTSNYQNGQNVPVSTSNYQNGQNVPVSTSNYQNGQNVPVSTSNYRNGQNVPVSTSNYQNAQNISVSTSNFHNGQHIQTQMGSNFHKNTLQPQPDMNDCVQSPQRQMMQSLHSGFANNSSNVLPSATVGQMPPLYSQTNTNASNVYNVSINQRLSHPNQNIGAQNVQQPVQSHTAPQEQHSVSAPSPANVGNVPQDPRSNVQNILALLKVYRNVKLKYLMLNRENNLLRQQMQSSSQDNSGAVKPPLISILSDITVPSNNPIGGKEVSLNSTVQSSPPSNNRVQSPTLYNDPLNVPVHNVSQSSNSFSSHGYSTNTDLLNQRNYSVQMNLGSNANSTGQAVGSGTLRDSMGSIQANNQYLTQDGVHVTSSQSHAQTAPASESCKSVHTTNTSNLYSNKPLTFSSREAIKASLPLWKSVTQCSSQREYLDPKQPIVDSLKTITILEESASHTTNEPSSVSLTQKSEHSGPNVSKGIEPQIAIVSPLVQIKGLANEIRQPSKVVQHSEDLANSGISGLKENDHFNKMNLSFKSEDAQLRSSMVFSSPCTIEGSSNCNVDQTSAKNIETVDDDFQISGVCTLVEGNSSYDSSIAMMFEGSLQPQAGSPVTQTDLSDEHALQCSQGDVNMCDASQATSSFSPTTEVMAVKSEPEEEIESCVNMEDQQEANVCLQTQPDNNLPASDVFDLEANTVSDQLSELLTEFPFGIKNYMSEDKDTEVSLEKFTVKTEIPKKSVPFSCDDESESIEDMQVEHTMDTLTKETESTWTEDTNQQCVVERVPSPEVPTDEANSTQLEDDCFEICESPDEKIHITLLDQDQMNKLFPDESTEPIVNSEESLVESFAKDSEGPVGNDAVNAIKESEKSGNETISVPDKELFCCLFSWIAYTNGNAPKCNCKLTDLSVTKDLTPSFSLPAAMIKTEPSASDYEPLAENLKSTTDGLNPSLSDPCETKLDKIENAEILPPVLKRPKLEPIEWALESKPDRLIGNCSPREGIQAIEDLAEKHHEDQSQKDQRTNYTLTKEKVLQPKSPLVDPDSIKSKDPFLRSESKDDGPPKLEKLIIKTDFLKNKHSLKEKKKKKHKERKRSRVEEGGSRNGRKTYENTEMVGSANINNIDRRVKVSNERIIPPAGTVQQPERGIDKLKLSSSSDRSHSHNQAPSLDKRRGRRKSLPESHFEKVKNVPTVQEYLERKRELCNRRPGPKVDQIDDPSEIRHRVGEKPVMENLLLKLLTNPSKRGREKTLESLPNKNSSHDKGSLANKGFDQKSTSYKDKIYLSPCDVSRQAPYEGINLTKLQIRRSPEKPRHDERRESFESSVQNKEPPKMLEFKLCPEFDHRSPTTQERKEPKAVKEKSVVEGRHSPSQSTSSFKASSVKSSSPRPVQDSKATFNAFKQRFYEQRSKSLDNSL
ncbi:retroelement silencing factor 1 isoform X2 [Hyla sarda]|uniref:retroelement silencing factor 1 isoform X2 n=1 Tax=Hyla sarda TaxID=327740 RepID=UPI0024C38548|nr:retroelement silencing factor 1 isoform X2 [Hyla sarda]